MKPSQEQIDAWKKEYGKLFSVTIGSTDFVFREITFAEFDEITALKDSIDSAETEDFLVKKALLHPKMEDKDFDRLPAGIISSLADEILAFSGATDPKKAKEILDFHRQSSSDVRVLMKAFVLSTMPAYKEEELDHLTFDRLAEKVVLAEQIIKINQATMGIENEVTLDLIDPEEEQKKVQEQYKKDVIQRKPGQAVPGDPVAEKLAQALGG